MNARQSTRTTTSLSTLGLVALLLGGCGCAGSSEPRTDAPAAAGFAVNAWSIAFELPHGWSGGENDAAGYEFTDGKTALMLGRAPTATAPSLDAFFEGRVEALQEQGELRSPKRSERRIDGRPARELRADVAGGGATLVVRLLALEPTPAERVSLLMVAEAKDRASLSASWEFVLRSLSAQ